MDAYPKLTPGLVSVVTPVYNGEGHLSLLLDSVLAQTWDSVEMILVDDGSQDGTLQVAERYREKFHARGFDYRIVTEEHKNASGAINGGLPWVRGEFLIWPDSDDTLEPDSVRLRAEFLQKNPRYQCVRSLMNCLDERGVPVPPEEPIGDLEREDLFFLILEGWTFICCGCYMLRTDKLFEFYPRRRIPESDAGQNFQLLLPVLYHCPCPTIKQRLYNVYLRPDSNFRRKRTYEEGKKRYADLGALLDEVAAVSGIRDRDHLRRLQLWKQQRRYDLATEHGQTGDAVLALMGICRCGGLQMRWIKRNLPKLIKKTRFYRACRYFKRRLTGGRSKEA